MITRAAGYANVITGLSTTCIWDNRIVIVEPKNSKGLRAKTVRNW